MMRMIASALAAPGLILRGAFHPDDGEVGLEGAGTVLLVGNAGPAMWEVFAPHRDEAPNPLDRWTKRTVDPIAERFGARAVYPFSTPHPPFQRWALRAEAVYASPLGILIHPRYGLWHAYRAALLVEDRLALPPVKSAPNPCESCAGRPCLSACPVGAFRIGEYDVPACADHIRAPGADCLAVGCHARNACPVGREWRYGQAQIGFHMQAFARALPRLQE
jgi:ferredoxin